MTEKKLYFLFFCQVNIDDEVTWIWVCHAFELLQYSKRMDSALDTVTSIFGSGTNHARMASTRSHLLGYGFLRFGKKPPLPTG